MMVILIKENCNVRCNPLFSSFMKAPFSIEKKIYLDLYGQLKKAHRSNTKFWNHKKAQDNIQVIPWLLSFCCFHRGKLIVLSSFESQSESYSSCHRQSKTGKAQIRLQVKLESHYLLPRCIRKPKRGDDSTTTTEVTLIWIFLQIRYIAASAAEPG